MHLLLHCTKVVADHIILSQKLLLSFALELQNQELLEHDGILVSHIFHG